MKCTKCGAGKAKVLETRVHPQWSYLVRRRYKCNDCGERFFTLEVTSRLKGTVYEHMPSSEEALRKIVHRHHRDKEIIIEADVEVMRRGRLIRGTIHVPMQRTKTARGESHFIPAEIVKSFREETPADIPSALPPPPEAP